MHANLKTNYYSYHRLLLVHFCAVLAQPLLAPAVHHGQSKDTEATQGKGGASIHARKRKDRSGWESEAVRCQTQEAGKDEEEGIGEALYLRSLDGSHAREGKQLTILLR